jgi:16S rRNA (guanine1207-N2)-methyltransferase
MRKRVTPRQQGLPAAWLPLLRSKARPPVLILLGSPKLAADIVEQVGLETPTLYQMDLYQAEAVRAELAARNLTADVVTHADLWDLQAHFQSVIYPVELGGERMLKLDVIEQAFHIMLPGANLVVLSPYERDPFFPPALKKLYGRVHAPETGKATLLWCQRLSDHDRRRHEVTFQVRYTEDRSARFVSRPGVFSYGRFDNGARALVDVAEVKPGDSIVDLGCGCGTNGIICGLHAGPRAKVTFVDSNCRATALASLNATANGLKDFQTVTAWQLDELPRKSFDLVLANPPYFANLTIAKRFIDEAAPVLKRRGRMYLVTKQPEEISTMMARHFGPIDAVEHRGYNILCGTAPTR